MDDEEEEKEKNSDQIVQVNIDPVEQEVLENESEIQDIIVCAPTENIEKEIEVQDDEPILEKEIQNEIKVSDESESEEPEETSKMTPSAPKPKSAQIFKKRNENKSEVQNVTISVESESNTSKTKFAVPKSVPKQKQISQFFSTTFIRKQEEPKKKNENKDIKFVPCEHCGFGFKSPQAKSVHKMFCHQNPLRAKLHPTEKRKKETNSENQINSDIQINSEIQVDSEIEKNSEIHVEPQSQENILDKESEMYAYLLPLIFYASNHFSY